MHLKARLHQMRAERAQGSRLSRQGWRLECSSWRVVASMLDRSQVRCPGSAPYMGSSGSCLAGRALSNLNGHAFITKAGSGIDNHATAHSTKSHHHEVTEEGKNSTIQLR